MSNCHRLNIKANPSTDTQYEVCIAYRILSTIVILLVILAMLSLALSSCSESPTPYRPPAITFYATPAPLASVTPNSSSQPIETPLNFASPPCTNNLKFLENITIPDGTVVHPGDRIDKRWLIQNIGSCNWDENYRLKFVSGAELDAPGDQALYPARSGTITGIQIVFTAPAEPGIYRGAWQAYDPQRQPFGDPIFIQITVDTNKP